MAGGSRGHARRYTQKTKRRISGEAKKQSSKEAKRPRSQAVRSSKETKQRKDEKSKEAIELCKKDLEKHNICRRSQPGYLSGYSRLTKKDYNCKEIEKRTLDDNPQIYKIDSINDTCDDRFYKGAMVVAPDRDYHYYRLNDENIWTHKPGYKKSTMYDSSNRKILDPQFAKRDYGGTLNYKSWFSGEKVSLFSGLEYYSWKTGLIYKIEYDTSIPRQSFEETAANSMNSVAASSKGSNGGKAYGKSLTERLYWIGPPPVRQRI